MRGSVWETATTSSSWKRLLILRNSPQSGRDARYERNAAWLQVHATEVYTRYRGKCICIAGEELFVADTPEEILVLATAVHSEDDGRFLYYISREKVARIYANAWGVGFAEQDNEGLPLIDKDGDVFYGQRVCARSMTLS